MTLKVVDPIEITSAVLTSSDISEPDISNGEYEWVAGNYVLGDEIIKSSTHRKYRCIVSETTDDPEVGATGDSTATWLDVGPTNKWAMFDDKTTTKTVSDTSFSLTLSPVNYVNSIAFFGLDDVDSIDVVVKNSLGDVVYNESMNVLDLSSIYDYYTYFFYQVAYKSEIIFDDLPPYISPEITVTFNGSNMSIGALVTGFSSAIGHIISDTKTENLDYSRQEYDELGELTYVQRPIIKLNTYEVLSEKYLNPYIQALITKLRGKNTLWIGDIGGNQQLITYGRFERSPIPFTMPNHVRYSITVRGSI